MEIVSSAENSQQNCLEYKLKINHGEISPKIDFDRPRLAGVGVEPTEMIPALSSGNAKQNLLQKWRVKT